MKTTKKKLNNGLKVETSKGYYYQRDITIQDLKIR